MNEVGIAEIGVGVGDRGPGCAVAASAREHALGARYSEFTVNLEPPGSWPNASPMHRDHFVTTESSEL